MKNVVIMVHPRWEVQAKILRATLYAPEVTSFINSRAMHVEYGKKYELCVDYFNRSALSVAASLVVSGWANL